MTIIHEENIFLQQPLDSQEEAFKFLAPLVLVSD